MQLLVQFLFSFHERPGITMYIRSFLVLVLFTNNSGFCQLESEQKYYTATVAFYNLENLFDIYNDPKIDDEEFLPDGVRTWTQDKYNDKLEKLSTVLEKLGDDDGPEILGVCEVENKTVLEDLINTEKLKSRKYSIVHINSPDKRGIDVALLYKTKYFSLLTTKSVNVIDTSDLEFKTRNLLVVTGILSNDTITFIINHWPSRRGGGKDEKRVVAANTARRVVDSLLKKNKDAKIILMGDFNDNPKDPSISKYLNAQPEKKLKDMALFNAMYNIHKKGYGTLSYQGIWNLFDQMILSKGLIDNKNKKYFYQKESASIFYKKWLINQEGQYTGAPFRAFSGSEYIGGYSDHLPVYIYLIQKAKE